MNGNNCSTSIASDRSLQNDKFRNLRTEQVSQNVFEATRYLADIIQAVCARLKSHWSKFQPIFAIFWQLKAAQKDPR